MQAPVCNIGFTGLAVDNLCYRRLVIITLLVAFIKKLCSLYGIRLICFCIRSPPACSLSHCPRKTFADLDSSAENHIYYSIFFHKPAVADLAAVTEHSLSFHRLRCLQSSLLGKHHAPAIFPGAYLLDISTCNKLAYSPVRHTKEHIQLVNMIFFMMGKLNYPVTNA